MRIIVVIVVIVAVMLVCRFIVLPPALTSSDTLALVILAVKSRSREFERLDGVPRICRLPGQAFQTSLAFTTRTPCARIAWSPRI